MAEATKSTRTVTTTEEAYTLTLSADERSYLLGLLGSQPAGGVSNAVYNALMLPADGDSFDYKGVTYDLKAQYRDTSGDLWHFTGARDENGVPLLTCKDEGDEYANWSLPRLADYYARLTKV